MKPIYWRQVKDAAPGEFVLVDVRTPMEYEAGALPGAINIPLDTMRSGLAGIPKNKPIVVYCGVGLRGYLASNILRMNGFDDVRNLVGGIKTYRAAVSAVAAPVPFGNTQRNVQTHAKPISPQAIRIDACGLACPVLS